MTPRDIDYDSYYGKHCARYYGWLPASRQEKRLLGRSPKYFTLCGHKAIDVFMLEKEGVLERDEKGRLPHVIVVEESEDDWAAIIALLRPPVIEAVVNGSLQDLILYEDDDEILDLLRRGESARPSKDQRDKLIRRERAGRLRSEFPFDIVNFDPCDGLVELPLQESRLYSAFETLFELQSGVSSFLLFVTTNITRVHPQVESAFAQDLADNVAKHSRIRTALVTATGSADYDGIDDENKRRAIGFTKSVIMPAARAKNWTSEHKGVYVYEFEPGGTRMLSSVLRLSKEQGSLTQSAYLDDIVAVIAQMPQYYSHQAAGNDRSVTGHLRSVVEYRESIHGEFATSM